MSNANPNGSSRKLGTAATVGPVLIVGTGLLGTSLGLALSRLGVPVLLSDTSPTARALARDMGAGQIYEAGTDVSNQSEQTPRLVVVCAPPDVAAACVEQALLDFPDAFVTDAASVKARILTELQNSARLTDADLARYVGSHPMAGREKAGAGAADADLFIGRPWVLAAHETTDDRALVAFRSLAVDVGALPVELAAAEHDQAVALVSHVPQLMSSLLAAQLAEASPQALSLAGQGLRDTTRIAASDPALWTAIIAGNRHEVAGLLKNVSAGLDNLIAALETQGDQALSPGVVGAVNAVMTAGNNGRARIPGKHGQGPRRYQVVSVLVPDEPGQLGRLFNDVGAIGVNIEDFNMEHSAGQPVGQAHLSVLPVQASPLAEALSARGWRIVSA